MTTATETVVMVTTRAAMSQSEKYCFDIRIGTRGEQVSARVRRYSFISLDASRVEDAAADIRDQWHAKVAITGPDWE